MDEEAEAQKLLLSLGPMVSEWLSPDLNLGSLTLLVSPVSLFPTFLIPSTSPTPKVGYLLPATAVTYAWPDVNLQFIGQIGSTFYFKHY